MTLKDTPAFNAAFNELAELYNLLDFDDRRLRYFQALSDLEIASVEEACTEAAKRAGVSTCRFFPLPGTLRELASNVHRVSPSCDKCGGTGLMNVEPNMEQVRRLYGPDATADSAQLTATRCDCRS